MDNRTKKKVIFQGDGGFTFTTQKDYETLGDVIGEVVYEMMEKEGLQRRWVSFEEHAQLGLPKTERTEKQKSLYIKFVLQRLCFCDENTFRSVGKIV